MPRYVYPRSDQAVFDIVARHLLTQMRRASNWDSDGREQARYHADDGAKCAIGCLIHPNDYRPDFEGYPVDLLRPSPNRRVPDRLHEFLKAHSPLLRSLQVLHDDVDPSEWRGHLGDIARHHGLSWAVLKAIPEAPSG